ncbi:ABC transporter permease, partial [Aliarcobacter butzleri]
IKAKKKTIKNEKNRNKKEEKSKDEGNLTAQNIKEKYENLTLELEEITKLEDDLFNKFKEEKLVNDLSSYINSNKTS